MASFGIYLKGFLIIFFLALTNRMSSPHLHAVTFFRSVMNETSLSMISGTQTGSKSWFRSRSVAWIGVACPKSCQWAQASQRGPPRGRQLPNQTW